MSRGSEKTFSKDDIQVHEKVLNIRNHWQTANQKSQLDTALTVSIFINPFYPIYIHNPHLPRIVKLHNKCLLS